MAVSCGSRPGGARRRATGGTGAWDTVSPFWGLNGVFAPWNNATNAADTALFGGTAGTVDLYLDADATAALKEGVAIYDLRLTAPGSDPVQDYLIQGNLVVQKMATR